MTERCVVVVGGGVIGLASAHYLQRQGWLVTVIDKGVIGGGCSYGNCGLVCPSHVLPLAEPGAIQQAIRSLFDPAAPFRVQPRIDLPLWHWLWQFARRCHEPIMTATGHQIQPLLESSLREYRQLIEQDGVDCEWECRGLLFVYQSRQPFEAYARMDRLLSETFQTPARRLDGDAVCELEPALKPGLAGGWFYEHDAHLRPDKLVSSWRRLLEGRGVTFREHCELHGLDRTDGRVTQLQTSQGPMAADAAVIATGAWTPLLAEAVGDRLPIQPGKGYSMTMPRPSRCPVIPLIFPEHRVAVTPMQSGYRLGSIMEFAGYDSSLNPDRLQLLPRGAAPYLHEPTAEPIVERWTGWRPMTYDSLPIIDRSPSAENVWIAAGHNMVGISMAPGTGRLVGELVSQQPPHLDPAPYSLRRFRE